MLVTELMRIKKHIFTPNDSRNILNLNENSANQILISLKKKGWILQLKRGISILTGAKKWIFWK